MEKYDVIGDIHGCFKEMEELLQELGYSVSEKSIAHPDSRIPVFLGDLTDRGPASVKVLTQVCNWILAGHALYCPGNHCDKLYRYFQGRNVQLKNGLETTVTELEQLPLKNRKAISNQFKKVYEQSPLYLVLDQGSLVVAHAGIRPDMIGEKNKRVKTFVLYGDITGETLPDGRPVRRDWASNYPSNSHIIYGHTPVKTARKVGKTFNIDTGCVFGGSLTAFRWPELTIVSVDSHQPYASERFHLYN
ncbi:bis(5'-nucleosyl)-tetraphosphatase PrpE [Salipaludibacillus sp. CF4.18]|uniref:bis(5'-nucleosyl)-tetraphosphatase PrpE n=1 Tax=Salipaludibacillus sp. CF4.18 TaxID=3373081 RepID=UPI003EE7E342